MPRRRPRLAFSRRQGVRVAAALALAGMDAALAQTAPTARPPVVFAPGKLVAPARPLPVPISQAGRSFVYDPARGDPRRGGSSPDLLATGQVRWTTGADGRSATFDQGSLARVVINWDSFDIGAGYRVNFTQDKDPTKYVSALNRIWSLDPSVILGSLTADREVILVNANGVYFGRGARVDTGRFVASANHIADAMFDKGLRNVTDGSAVFSMAGGADGFQDTAAAAAIGVEAGAEIRSAAGGDVLLVAPRVVNQGRIETPRGQAVLAAGDRVYLMSSSDPAQRGLIVAVDPVKNADGSVDGSLGGVENAAAGSTTVSAGDGTGALVTRINEIRAEGGTVNLVGLAVKQNGVINATTAVKGANGEILLQAMASTTTVNAGTGPGTSGARGLGIDAGSSVRVAQALGSVELGAGSVTAVRPDAGSATQIDAEVFNPSRIRVEGQTVAVGAGASIVAPAGRIEMLAAASAAGGVFDSQRNYASEDDGSRITVAPGALISAAGLRDVAVAGSRNQGRARLFRIELADAPVQRSGPLYRSTVYFDLRDGSKITAANVQGSASAIGRTASERATAGGSVRLESQGTLALDDGATLDVSGGTVRYGATTLRNSLAVRDGLLIGFQRAGAGVALDALLDAPQAVASPAYTEGRDGGTLALAALRLTLAADTVGSVVVGERQRSGADARAQPAQFTLGRLNGIGSPLTAAVALVPDGTLPPAEAGAAAPLSLAALQEGGFGKVAVLARSIQQTGGGRLDVGPGGVIELQSQGAMSLDGHFAAAGGRIVLTALGDLSLQPGTRLDAAGLWTNDTVAGQGTGGAGVPQPQGGSVSVVSQQGRLAVGAGTVLDVSGGATLAASGSLARGSAGSLTLAGASFAPSQPGAASSLAGVDLRGFDFGSGGRLAITAQDLTVGGSASAAHFSLDSAFFGAHGFGSISVKTVGVPLVNRGDIVITSGTQLHPVLQNWELAAGFRWAPSGAMREAVARASALDSSLAERQPVNLSLNAAGPAAVGATVAGSRLSVERGAAILLEPGATLSLAATRQVDIGAAGGLPGQLATLSAPGGKLLLALDGARGGAEQADDPVGFLADQALWLGAGARLSVDGVVQQRPYAAATAVATADGPATPLEARSSGRVLGGGRIALEAARGYVVAEAGSAMSLDGASGSLNLPGLTEAVTVSRAAGSLSVSTPEGFVLDGRISARAPVDAQGRPLADGGRLSLSVARGLLSTNTGGTPYPDRDAAAFPRLVSVGDFDGLLAARGATLGSDLFAALGNGVGYTRASLLQGAGFSGLRLAAGDAVRFEASLRLDMPLGLQLDAPALAAAPGSRVTLSSGYAQLGDTFATAGTLGDADREARREGSADGSTQLQVIAPTIDVQGRWALQGFSRVRLDAGQSPGGEIRLLGVDTTGTSAGRLAFAGTLEMAAGQVYAGSGTRYALAGASADAAGAGGSTLVFEGGAGGVPARPPLSVFGALSAEATDIVQAGVLRQPFGRIALRAERSLTLAEHSLTSVSGEGVTVPYGATANLALWNLPGGGAAMGDTLPLDKGVALAAASLLTSPGAVVSAAGGGSVQASEFFPGVGGSQDIFDTPGLYAVLPDYAATLPLLTGGGLLADAERGRQIVITTPGSGLAPGRYALFPARDALLAGALPQGAFLVSRASDAGKVVLTQSQAQDDGSTLVAGYFSQAGSRSVGLPGERFLVQPAGTFNARSEIRLTDMSDFLAGRAATQGSSLPTLPRDAGRVQIVATGDSTVTWQAAIDLRAAGGKAGALDVSATRLALVDAAARTPPGALGITAGVVSASGAGSVLLGATRSEAGGSTVLDGSATRTVTLELGPQGVQVEELLLAAREGITLAAGTSVTAAGTGTLGARTLTAAGDGALLAVSANALTLQRSGTALASGQIEIGRGSRLAGPQLLLDATRTLQVGEGARLEAQALGLGAQRLVLGRAGAGELAGATVLTGALLETLQATPDLRLVAYESIDFAGPQHWARRDAQGQASVVGQRLELDSPLLRGLPDDGGAAAEVDIAAQAVLLRNSSGRSSEASGSGTLQLQALPTARFGSSGGLTVGPGVQALAFDAAALRSRGDLVLAGSGSTQAQGQLTLAAARLTATTGTSQRLAATGTLEVAHEDGSTTLGERVGGGAVVELAGARVVQAGRIELPAGQLTLGASGAGTQPAVSLAAGSLSSVAGYEVAGPDGFDSVVNAGRIDVVATQGRVELAGTLDASAGRGEAGQLRLQATGADGALRLAEGSAQLLARGAGGGGSLRVDVTRLDSVDRLAALAGEGGVSRELELRLRSGDLVLGRSVAAGRIALAADAGSLTLAGASLDARSETGGVVQLAAAGDVALTGSARIDAGSRRAGAQGGDVLLASSEGRVRIGADAVVDTRGDDSADGRIVLRAQRAAGSVRVDALDTAHLLGGEVDIEAVRVWNGVTTLTTGTGTGATLGQTAVRNDNNGFMAAKDTVLAALGVRPSDAGRVNLRAGVEVRSAGNLNVAADWALNAERPGGDAGFLTLRAAGQLTLNGSLSDGFTTATPAGLLNDNARSWSFRLVAGADLAAASPLAVREGAASGDLTVAGNRFVRTGAGSIELAAGRDIVFAGGTTAQGSAYVAGRRSAEQAGVLASLFAGQSAKPSITEQGGRLALRAGRDIVSAEATQLVNNWLWRSGIVSGSAYAASSQLAWWTEFSRFRQTLGSFGGGNLSVEAGNDVRNLQAFVPTVAWADSRSTAEATLQVRNGGDLGVRAGRDILGGQFLVGRGAGLLQAGGRIDEAAGNQRVQAPLLALADGQWRVVARGDAVVGGVFNPTATPVSAADSRANVSPYFFSYGPDTALSLASAAGDARLFGAISRDTDYAAYGLASAGAAAPLLYQTWPASLRIEAPRGDVTLLAGSNGSSAPALMFPSATGSLAVWAGGDLSLMARLAMSDSAPAAFPRFDAPLSRTELNARLLDSSAGLLAGTVAGQVAGTALHAADTEPVRLHAEGSFAAAALSGGATLVLPKPVVLSAGADVLGLQLVAQNQRAGDRSSVSAGRSLRAGAFGEVTLGGPGALDVSAGGQLDLENSAGISTVGNTRNASLPGTGASVTVAAATAGTLDLEAFAARYLRPGGAGASPRAALYRERLLAHVREALQRPTLGDDEAWAQFTQFPAAEQAGFARGVLASEFTAVYLSGPTPTAAALTAELRSAFERHQAALLAAGEAALARSGTLTLPGRDVLGGEALAAYLAELRTLKFGSIDIEQAVAARVASLTSVREAWEAAQRGPAAPDFERLRREAMVAELASAGAQASLYGRRTLPLRLALFDQGFLAAELGGFGSFVAQPYWQGVTPVFGYRGALDMTQSSVVTERGGDITLLNAGGAINVGLKADGDGRRAKGVIALGGGNIFGLSRGDFQVNTQRVFVVGRGDMSIWSSAGDIDSGRGANTAVAAPPLQARRTADGTVFETPATTTGSGLGILEDAAGRREGTIGLFAAFGEILALDAFIRAPQVVLGATVRGADNIQSPRQGGAGVAVSAPALTVAAPATTAPRAMAAGVAAAGAEERPRNALLTVELLGLGPADDRCSEQDERDGRCRRPPR